MCLRILIRRCVYENVNKDEIQKLFPPEVSPELQRLLVLLLQKFQREWKNDALKDQVWSLFYAFELGLNILWCFVHLQISLDIIGALGECEAAIHMECEWHQSQLSKSFM